jgi:hypothetical protein
MGPSLLVGTTANESGRYPSFSSPSGHRSRIAVRSQGTIFLLDDDEVLAVKTQPKLCDPATANRFQDVTGSISVMAEKLKSYGFTRIHRSTLVNSFYVKAASAVANRRVAPQRQRWKGVHSDPHLSDGTARSRRLVDWFRPIHRRPCASSPRVTKTMAAKPERRSSCLMD